MPEHSFKHLMNVILFLLSVLMQVEHSAVLARTMGRASQAAPASHPLLLLHLLLPWNILAGCSCRPAASSVPPASLLWPSAGSPCPQLPRGMPGCQLGLSPCS